MKMKTDVINDVCAQLKKAKSAAVICHVRPDGDTIGSGLALTYALKAAGKKAYLLCDDAPPEKFSYIPEINSFIKNFPDGLDTVISVDCADLNRLGKLAEKYVSFSGVTVNIDHHISNTAYGKINYVFDCPATCQIMTEIIEGAGFEITENIANFLMLGLITDSGNFSHKNVTPQTYITAAKLCEKGADANRINYEMFARQPKQRAILYGRVINRIRFELEDKLAIITVTLDDLRETNADKSVTEGFVDFPLTIDGVEVAVSLLEVRKGQYKTSLRSKNANVSAVAAQFGGGGHFLASGCMLFGEYEEVIDKLRYAVSQYL